MKSAITGAWAIGAAAGLAFAAVQPLSAQAAVPPACTGPASNTWVNLTIEGLRNSNGVVALTLYPDDPARFLKRHGSLYVTKVNARAGRAQGCIFLPEAGAYGLALYHDENANGKIDRNGLDIPKEGFGFSNNPGIFLSAPSFAKVRFVVGTAGTSLRIRMKYP